MNEGWEGWSKVKKVTPIHDGRRKLMELHKGFWSSVMRKSVSWGLCVMLVWVMALGMPGQVRAAEEESSESREAMLGFGSGLLTLVYLPVKTVYAVLGGIIGTFAYGLTGGDLETAKLVWEPSVYGTYVITPDHLKGNQPVRFVGTSPYQDESFITEK
jgi:hypothetical protein